MIVGDGTRETSAIGLVGASTKGTSTGGVSAGGGDSVSGQDGDRTGTGARTGINHQQKMSITELKNEM